MDENIIFNPQKHDPSLQKINPQIHPAPKTPPLALSAALEASASRVFTSGTPVPLEGQDSANGPLEKQPDDCTDFSISKVFWLGGVFLED